VVLARRLPVLLLIESVHFLLLCRATATLPPDPLAMMTIERAGVNRMAALRTAFGGGPPLGAVPDLLFEVGAEATAARKAVYRSSISRSTSGNSRVSSTPAVYHRALGQSCGRGPGKHRTALRCHRYGSAARGM
jgi:hypothetical protein